MFEYIKVQAYVLYGFVIWWFISYSFITWLLIRELKKYKQRKLLLKNSIRPNEESTPTQYQDNNNPINPFPNGQFCEESSTSRTYNPHKNKNYYQNIIVIFSTHIKRIIAWLKKNVPKQNDTKQ